MNKIVFLVPKVCCWLYRVQLNCGLAWVMGPNFHFPVGLVWLSQSFDGLDWAGLKKLDPRTTLGDSSFCQSLRCSGMI